MVIVICGGDGTIMWSVEESIKAGIDLSTVLFVTVPIGTGNDFSKSIGWGGSPLRFTDQNILPLKKRII